MLDYRNYIGSVIHHDQLEVFNTSGAFLMTPCARGVQVKLGLTGKKIIGIISDSIVMSLLAAV